MHVSAKELPPGDWRLVVYGRSRISGQNKRESPRLADRSRVLELQGNRCLYCEIPIGAQIARGSQNITLRAHWDHFVPFAYLASNPSSNWVLACHVCNGIKLARMFQTVQAARDLILPRRLTKGYESPEDVLFRISHPETEGDVWPQQLRLKNGSTVHRTRQIRIGQYATACGKEFPGDELRHPQTTNRHCLECIRRAS